MVTNGVVGVTPANLSKIQDQTKRNLSKSGNAQVMDEQKQFEMYMRMFAQAAGMIFDAGKDLTGSISDAMHGADLEEDGPEM